MTETELINKVGTEGWTIIETKTLGEEGTGDNLLTIIALLTVKQSGDMLLRQWLNYYKKVDGTCIWREHDPFPAPQAVSFGQRVNAKITALVAAATIKAAYAEKIDESSETALVVAVKTDNTFQAYHVWADASDVIQIQALTGTYPIG